MSQTISLRFQLATCRYMKAFTMVVEFITRAYYRRNAIEIVVQVLCKHCYYAYHLRNLYDADSYCHVVRIFYNNKIITFSRKIGFTKRIRSQRDSGYPLSNFRVHALHVVCIPACTSIFIIILILFYYSNLVMCFNQIKSNNCSSPFVCL